MANDKDFIVKNAVEVGGSTKTTLGTVTNNNVDLSTGNYFSDTPSGNSTYTFSNAGANQSFQIEVTGGLEEIESNFSTDLYTGSSSDLTITNGLDLSTDGGLVWIKNRDVARSHYLTDTEVNKRLRSDGTSVSLSSVISFNTDGFNVATGDQDTSDGNTNNYVAWAFKAASGFFDIVTYSGQNTDLTISHSLGVTPGMVIVKKTSGDGDWGVWHRSLNQVDNLILNSAGDTGQNGWWTTTAPTSTTFNLLGNRAPINQSGSTYVAYLFAHDTASDGQVQCGSYTGNGSTSGPTITLGWEPQWLLIKNASTSQNWMLLDYERGFTSTSNRRIRPNLSNAEDAAGDGVYSTSTGFTLNGTQAFLNENGSTFIYIAIRKGSALDLTWPSSIEWAGGAAPAAPATGETDLFNISTDDGGTTYQGFKVADNLS